MQNKKRIPKPNLLSPNYVINYAYYKELIYKFLTSEECHIFLDTNILTQLYKTFKEARFEFYDWIEQNKERIHIPNWVYNEYIKHSITKIDIQKLTPLKIHSLIKELDEQYNILSLYVGEADLKETEFTQLDDFFTEIESSISNLKKIEKVIKKINNADEVTKEISEKLLHLTIKNNLDINSYLNEFQIRLENKIPPGFYEKKENNRIGDFIIWKEILLFCKDKNVKNCIFITRDEKKDWCYTLLIILVMKVVITKMIFNKI